MANLRTGSDTSISVAASKFDSDSWTKLAFLSFFSIEGMADRFGGAACQGNQSVSVRRAHKADVHVPVSGDTCVSEVVGADSADALARSSGQLDELDPLRRNSASLVMVSGMVAGGV